jgi:transposase
MTWPPNSPDLNPIELVWRWIKGKVAGEMLRTKENIVTRYTYWWNQFPLELYKKYTDKLPELMKELKKSKGYAQFS